MPNDDPFSGRNVAPALAAKKPDAKKPSRREQLPEHKDDLAALAIERGVPSFEAWNSTVPELKKMLEA